MKNDSRDKPIGDFEKALHNMFSSIWDCEIDHPLWQETVGEIMTAVIEAHEKCVPEPCGDAVSRNAVLNEFCINCEGNGSNTCTRTKCYRAKWIRELPPVATLEQISQETKSPCNLCAELEKGDTLYSHSTWDGGIGFDYIDNIQYCPKCGRALTEYD